MGDSSHLAASGGGGDTRGDVPKSPGGGGGEGVQPGVEEPKAGHRGVVAGIVQQRNDTGPYGGRSRGA